jgi:hypothetical protein
VSDIGDQIERGGDGPEWQHVPMQKPVSERIAMLARANPEAVGDLLRIAQNVARLTRNLHDSPKSLLSHLTQALPDIDAAIAKAKGAKS